MPIELWPGLRYGADNTRKDPTELEVYSPEDVDAWKRLNSFMSRLLQDEFPRWMVLPYWEISKALETPPQEGVVFECHLWVATQWLTQCGQLLRRNMGLAEGLDEEAQEAIPTGPLCESAPRGALSDGTFGGRGSPNSRARSLQRGRTAQGSPCPVKGMHRPSASQGRLLPWMRRGTAPKGREGDALGC